MPPILRRSGIGTLGLCVWLVSGCASTQKGDPAPQFPPTPSYPPNHRYTLDELIDLSIHRNASLDVARYDALAAQGLVDQVKSLWLPSLHYDFAAIVYNNDFNYKARALKLVSVNVPITGNYNLEHSVNFTQILATGGKRTSGLKQAKMFAAIQRLEVLVRQDSVAFDVANYYYLVCLTNDIDRILDDTVRRINVLRDVSRGLNKRGSLRASELDTLEADYLLLQLDQIRIAVQAGRQQAYEALKQSIGLNRNEPLILKEASLPPAITLKEAISVSAAIVKGFLHRPENQQVDLFTHIRQEQVKLAKAAFAPNVAIAGGYNATEANKYNVLSQIQGFLTTLIVDIPVYYPGGRAALLQALGMEQSSLAFQREVEQLITLEIDVTALDAQKALSTLFKTAQAMEIAADHDRASRQAYGRELIPASGVVVGIVLDGLAKLQHLQALYVYHSTRAKLSRVTADREIHYGS